MQLPAPARRYLRFGPHTVDFVARELRNDSGKISLQDKPFQILAILLEQPGEVVTREQLRKRLWQADTYVDFDHSINTAVKKLREALEHDGDEAHYIETLPKRGYRFIGSVEGEPAALQQPEGGESEASPVAAPGHQPNRHRFLPYSSGAAVALLVVLIALNATGTLKTLHRNWNELLGIPTRIHSVAVLPLQNLSPDPEQEYFADGLTDALTTDLGKVSSLRVISRTSVLRYKQLIQPLSQIARELDVDAVVEGTVLRSGNELRVTVQLIRVSPEEHLWAERYERDVSNLITLEKDLALAIAHEVTGHLTTAEETAISNPKTANPRAYDAYLRGRYLWKDRTQKVAAGAGAYFEEALREDPNFALAYSGLADYYTVSWGNWINVPVGMKYARKAVELGPDLAETHASLGIALQYQCEFAEAGKELKRAVQLNPNYATAHHWYAIHLVGMGRVQEALTENEHARRLDPFALPINFYRSYILQVMGQYEQALEQADIVAAVGSPVAAHRIRASAYWAQARVPEAIAEEKAAYGFEAIPGRSPEYWDEVLRAYNSGGTQSAMRRAAQFRAAQIEEMSCTKPPGAHVPSDIACDPGTVAGTYEAAGDKEKALYWLKRGIADSRASRDGQCWVANTLETGYPTLRSDPRFKEILRSLGLPENPN